MPPGERVIRLRGVRKDYHALRPLRVEAFDLHQGETVALLGFDRAAAEALVNLITAATLPDAGDVEVFNSTTRDISDADAWFRTLDQFGVLGERVVLVPELTVEQNLALPLTFEVDDLPPNVRDQIYALAAEVGISDDDMAQPIGAATPATQLRVRLSKALALNPRVLLAEHPTATLSSGDVERLAADLTAIAARRHLAMLVLTADAGFAEAACGEVRTLRPATGELTRASSWRRWLGAR
jgi:ABC-type lipoprotein export system ATPase subunit